MESHSGSTPYWDNFYLFAHYITHLYIERAAGLMITIKKEGREREQRSHFSICFYSPLLNVNNSLIPWKLNPWTAIFHNTFGLINTNKNMPCSNSSDVSNCWGSWEVWDLKTGSWGRLKNLIIEVTGNKSAAYIYLFFLLVIFILVLHFFNLCSRINNMKL